MTMEPRNVETTAQPRDTDALRLRIFAFTFAIASLFHHGMLSSWGELLAISNLVTISAIWLLLRPSSTTRLYTLVAATGFAWWWHMPVVVNHVMTLGLIFLSFIVAVTWMKVAGRKPLDAGSLWRTIAPMLRIEIVLLYIFATMAKVNGGFFNPRLSAAVEIAAGTFKRIPFLPPGHWTDPFAIWGTLALEIGLPLAFLFRRTRLPALLVGWLFHSALALENYLAFSAMAFFFYTLFLPDDFPERMTKLRESKGWLRALTDRTMAFAAKPWAFPVAVLAWLGLGALSRVPALSLPMYHGLRVAFIAYSVSLGLVMFAYLRQGWPVYRPGAFRLAHPVLVLGPLLLVSNALCPYVGLKTQTSYTMFSNLQTEADQWNHLLLPKSMRVFHFQDDLVQVHGSNDKLLQQCAEQDCQWVWFELRRYLAERPDTSVRFTYKGKEYDIERAGDDPVFSEPPNYLLRKLFWFRPVRRPENNICVH
jgi:hypothetical protein